MHIHSSLAASLRRQEDASPNDWEATFRNMALFDLAADMELGFFLSYYRNFAIPSIASTLSVNAEIPQRPMKRSYDTGIVIYELIASGLESRRCPLHMVKPRTNRASRAALKTGLAVRNAIYRRRPRKLQPHFTPGAPGSPLYPNGYSQDQIGPVNIPSPGSH